MTGIIVAKRHVIWRLPCEIVYADRTNAHGTEGSFVLRLYILCSASCKMHLAVGSLPANRVYPCVSRTVGHLMMSDVKLFSPASRLYRNAEVILALVSVLSDDNQTNCVICHSILEVSRISITIDDKE